MMTLARSWWRERTQREHWLLAIMAATLALTIAWFGVLRPLQAAAARAEARHMAAQTALADIQADTLAIRAAEASGKRADATPLVERVSRRITDAGLSAEKLETSGDGRVTLRIVAVRPPVLLRWLAGLEAADGIIVERATLTRNADATIAATLALRGQQP